MSPLEKIIAADAEYDAAIFVADEYEKIMDEKEAARDAALKELEQSISHLFNPDPNLEQRFVLKTKTGNLFLFIKRINQRLSFEKIDAPIIEI